MNRFIKGLVDFTMSGIQTIITCHLEIFFRYVLDKELDEIKYGDGFLNIKLIFMPIVMEGDICTVIRINPRGSNHRSAKITADIFYNGIRIAKVRLGVNVEAMFVIFIDGRFRFFERIANALIQEIEQSSLESLAQIRITKEGDVTPEPIIRKTAFCKETVDMGIPFKRSSKGVKDTDKTGNKVFAFIKLMEHFKKNTADSLKKTIQKRAILKKEVAQGFINGKNEMAMRIVEKFEGHFGGTFNGVFVPAGRAKSGVTAERDKFKLTTMRASKHGTAKRGIPAVHHLVNVFHNNGTRVKNIFNFLIMFFKNFLKYVHKTIMRQSSKKRNPYPLKIEGQGS